MKQFEIAAKAIPAQNTYYLFTEEFIEQLLAKQDKIIELLEKNSVCSLNGYVTEKQAMKILNKKTTWFWQMRKEGRLKFKHIGQTVYYELENLHQLLTENHS